MNNKRIGFAGTPDFARRILSSMLAAAPAKFEMVAVYTQPDRAAGRNRRMKSSPVKLLAAEHSLPVFTPISLKDEGEQTNMRKLNLDLLVVAAYGLLLPPAVLEIPTYGCVNVHASLLPKWRGAAPIERSLMAGDLETGVSIMQMNRGLDTGPVYLQKSIPITPTTTGATLHDQMASLGADALLECLADIESRQATPQDDSQASLAPKLVAKDSMINWHRPATQIDAQIRALAYRSPAVTFLGSERLRILDAQIVQPHNTKHQAPGKLLIVSPREIKVACGEGELLLKRIGLSRGKGKPLDPQALHNGFGDLLIAGMHFALSDA